MNSKDGARKIIADLFPEAEEIMGDNRIAWYKVNDVYIDVIVGGVWPYGSWIVCFTMFIIKAGKKIFRRSYVIDDNVKTDSIIAKVNALQRLYITK